MSEKYLLIIEDQLSIAMLVKNKLEQTCHLPVLILKEMSEVEEVLNANLDIAVALCDLNLPGCKTGEAVRLLRKKRITTVVLTGTYRDDMRSDMLELMVADYVVKDRPSSIDYAVATVSRLAKNERKNIWILTPGSKHSQRLMGLLKIHRYNVSIFTSFNEVERELKHSKPNLLLLEGVQKIDDENVLPFIQNIRNTFQPADLPIIACEPSQNICFAIQLMKYGVNDFFNSNFTSEELYVRIAQNIESSLAYQEIEKAASTDAMTGLFNRRYFFENAGEDIQNADRQECSKFLLMADIDHFKNINDTYGHQIGDDAIVFVSNTISEVFEDCIVARFGGEEFCVYGRLTQNEVLSRAETLRKMIEDTSEEKSTVSFTISSGITFEFDSLDSGIAKADEALYESKENGRNKVSLKE